MSKIPLKPIKDVHDIQENLVKVRDSLADAAADLKEKAGEVMAQSFSNIKDKSVALKEGVDAYVAKRPFKAVCLALLSGLAMGAIWRKNNKKEEK